MKVFVSACGCHPRADCRVDDWISAITDAGHEVAEQREFVGYQQAFEAIDEADAVLGLVNWANGTQWTIELSASVDGSSNVAEVFYEGEKKPTFLHWPDQDRDPYPFVKTLVENGAIRLPTEFDRAVLEVLSRLEE